MNTFVEIDMHAMYVRDLFQWSDGMMVRKRNQFCKRASRIIIMGCYENYNRAHWELRGSFTVKSATEYFMIIKLNHEKYIDGRFAKAKLSDRHNLTLTSCNVVFTKFMMSQKTSEITITTII